MALDRLIEDLIIDADDARDIHQLRVIFERYLTRAGIRGLNDIPQFLKLCAAIEARQVWRIGWCDNLAFVIYFLHFSHRLFVEITDEGNITVEVLDEAEPLPQAFGHYIIAHWPIEHEIYDLTDEPRLVLEALRMAKEIGAVSVAEFAARWGISDERARAILRAATRLDREVAYGGYCLYRAPTSP